MSPLAVSHPPRPAGRASAERGGLLVGLMVAVSILLILSTVALQTWSMTYQRE